MKKRLPSLALCLALCLGLLPVGVLATEGGGIYVPPSTSTGGGGVYVETHPVTVISGETENGYDSIIEAFNNVDDGGTIRLNNDVTLEASPEVSGKNITLNLNGYVLGSNSSLTVKSGAALTVTNAGAENSEKPITAGLSLKLLVEKGSSFTCTDGGFQYLGLLSAGTGDYTLKLADGENHCTFGGFVQGDATATIGDLLKATPGMALYAEDAGSTVQIARSTLISKGFNYFSFYVGACSEHKMDANGACIYCGASYVASVTTNGGETNDYTSLGDALDAANDGDTVTLLSDVDLGKTYVTISKSITFDLNGKTLSSSKTWSSDGVLLVKDAAVTVKNGTVNATGIGSCAIRAYRSGASMTLEAVTATVTSDKSSVMVGDFGSAVIKSGDYQGLYVGIKSQVTLEGGTFRPYMDTITNKNVKSIFWKVNETTDATSRDCMELLEDGCVYLDESRNQVRTGGGFNTVVTVQKGTPIDTPVAKIGDVGYTSLSKAINAVQNGGTITLLNDLDLDNGAVLQVGSSKKNFTIDLDNHTLRADGACLIMLHNGSQLTLKNGTLDGSRCTSYDGVLYISSNSELTLENVTAKSGTVADTLNGQRSVLLAYVISGTVEFNGGTYTGGVLVGSGSSSTGNVVLKNGTFQKGQNSYSIKTEDSSKHLSDYLDEDSLSWKGDERLDLSSVSETADAVTVIPCNHNWVNGTCTICQKVCDHGAAEDGSMAAATCPICGLEVAVAEVNTTKYFADLSKAIAYAGDNTGSTVKLLKSVTGIVAIDKVFTLDLNGQTVDTLNVSAKATIKDSGATKGIIATLRVSSDNGLTISDLLEEGYAFRGSDGTWRLETERVTGNVIVQEVPIKSITAENPTPTAEYGKTSAVTLTAIIKESSEEGTFSCQWYKIGGTSILVEGATSSTYQLPSDLNAGTYLYRLTVTKDGYQKSCDFNVTVTKAAPTGEPKYTSITTSGKKLSDVNLTTEGSTFSVPGHVQWVEEKEGQLVEMDVSTEVKANTAYTWKFMPDDKENYNTLTGTITLWHKSSSGGSSGSVTPGTKTDTVKNPDGSTTKTETKADGSKTETTTASSGGGSTGTTVTKTDAKGNTTTEASAKLSDREVKEAQEMGEAVTVPVKGIAAAKDANAATKVKIDVPNNADKTTVEIPVENVTSGTVAVIVHEDGTEELVKDSKPTEHGVQLELSGSTTVKIIDNSKTFDDTKDHWSRDEVNFVAARELFNGVGGNQFGVSQPMTRGMVNTVLARLADVDTTPGQGQAWYEVGTDWAKKNGISDGTNPTAPVTREQLATLLYRYAGSPSVSGTLHAADAASVSDYAEDALLWANQNGIVNGVGSNTIAPKDNAQRAQVAAMLARYLQNQ